MTFGVSEGVPPDVDVVYTYYLGVVRWFHFFSTKQENLTMRSALWVPFPALGCMLAFGIHLKARDEAKAPDQGADAILARALEALGGAESFSTKKATRITTKGTYFRRGKVDMSVSNKIWWQKPDRLRYDCDYERQGDQERETGVFDGDTNWVTMNGPTGESQFEQTRAEASPKRAKRMAEVVFLDIFILCEQAKKDKDRFDVLRDGREGDKDLVGVGIPLEEGAAFHLWFDKKTNLPVKWERLEGAKGTNNWELRYDDFKVQEGIKYPAKITTRYVGKHFADIEVVEVKFLDKLPDDTFSKPKK
jgi:outer membrane lipoprotein-sorting protein